MTKTKKIKDCCEILKKEDKYCLRTNDNKTFKLPRKFSKKTCLTKKNKGFSMRSSCAPYKYCNKIGGKKTKKQFLYNPNDPKKSFDVYIDKNPKDTISIKYKTIDDLKNTINKLEKLYKEDKYPHKRIWQVGMIIKVRLEAMLKHKNTLYKKAKFVRERYNLAKKYYNFLKKRTKSDNRKDLKFKI